jgi:hypothetical protein
LDAEDSELPENELIELVLRELHIRLACIPKRAVRMKNYYMRKLRGLYMGLNTSVQQFVERRGLNDLNRYLFYSPEEHSKQLNQEDQAHQRSKSSVTTTRNEKSVTSSVGKYSENP